MFFASKETAVLKSVFIISLIFIYLEINLLFSEPLELFIEANFSPAKKLATFEKIAYVRIIFHFFIHTSVGFARVLIDAEKKFIRDDKTTFLKTMLEQSKSISNIIIGWDNQNFFKIEAEKEKLEAQAKKKGWCSYIGYAVLGYIIFANVANYLNDDKIEK